MDRIGERNALRGRRAPHRRLRHRCTWAVLAAHLDERQLIEVPMLVGQYHIVSFTLNTLGIQREPGLGGFDNKRQ
jgi:hypothetical protein